MEILYSLVAVLSTIFLVIWGWKMLNWAWLKPKKLEKRLREQGLRGTSYKLLFGDVKEMLRMDEAARSKPMNLSNDIIPRVIPFIDNTIKEYGGGDCYMWIGPTPSLVIMEPELIREVFNKSFNYLKPSGNPLTKLLARGVASYDKEKWAKHRRILNPAFQLDKLKLMVPAVFASCCEMLSKWEKIAPAEGSFELNVWPHLQVLTGDAISRTAFGSNYEEGRRIFELQSEQTDLALQAEASVYIPGWRFVPTKKNRRMKEIARQVKLLIMDMINKRVKMIQSGEARNENLLEILLESNLKEIEQEGNKKSGMSIDEVIEECKEFYLAGQETTSVLLVWTLILLSKHSDWQARARDEVQQVIGDKKPSVEELNHLKLMTMIINEVMRLYPPGFMFRRMTEEETKLGKLTLPAGVQLLLPAIQLHHDPKTWGDDVHEFNPERFSEGIQKATKGRLTYFPFGWGPRMCMGQHFALLEAKMALAMMLQKFSFELSPSYAHALHTRIALQPQYGAQLMLRKL